MRTAWPQPSWPGPVPLACLMLACPTVAVSGQPTCPDGAISIVSQEPTLENLTLAFSDLGEPSYAPGILFDDFSGLEQRITGIRFWGLGFYYEPWPGAADWLECFRDPQEFAIRIYEDDGGLPGNELYASQHLLSGVLVAQAGYPDYAVYQYDTAFDPPVVLRDGWISIVGGQGDECWFAWMSSFDGDQLSLFPAPSGPVGYGYQSCDMAFCLTTDEVAVYGACCDEATGVCEEGILMRDCAGRFLPDGTCDDFSPPCHPVEGACCFDDGDCEQAIRAACEGPFACRGDLNCDLVVDFDDIGRFIEALDGEENWPHADCLWLNADCNGDGDVNTDDIDPFVQCIVSHRECHVQVGQWQGPGSTCAQCPPQRIVLPEDMNTTVDGNTCGRANSCQGGCAAPFDAGPDAIHELEVSGEPLNVAIILDPGDNACSLAVVEGHPPDGECVAVALSSYGECRTECLALWPGTYSIVVDSWDRWSCLEHYELEIEECSPDPGRCCFGDPVECAELTEIECIGLGGSWDRELDCGTPCTPPPGDTCADAIPIESLPFAAQVMTSVMAADGPPASCDKYGPTEVMQNDVWFVWTAGGDGLVTATVRNGGGRDDIVLAVRDGCSTLDELYCVDEHVSDYEEVLHFVADADSTYYFQVGDAGWHSQGGPTDLFLEMSQGSGACCLPDGACATLLAIDCFELGGQYRGDNTDCEGADCPQPTPGDNCDTPVVVELRTDSLPYVDNNTTTGRGDDYRDTCLGRYDDGDDIIYELNVPETISVSITLDTASESYPRGVRYTGMLLADECPPGENCLLRSINGAYRDHIIDCVTLPPGTYYLMIDKWLLPADIPWFELRIAECEPRIGACCVDEVCAGEMTRIECHRLGGNWLEDLTCDQVVCPGEPGATCANPVPISLPADLPYRAWHSTCGCGDAYNGVTCLGAYDGGQEIIFTLSVTGAALTTDILISATEAYDVALALDDVCPPGEDCVSGCFRLENVTLAPGEHYLMVDMLPYRQDQWEWLTCTDFELTIPEGVP